MKIGIVCYPVIGGSGVVATELGIYLAQRGHQVHFFSYALPFRWDPDLRNLFYHQVETSNYPLFKYPPYTLTLAAKIASIAVQENLDIVHAHYAIPHAICGYLAREMIPEKNLKVITTLHGTDVTLVGSEKSFFDITRFSIVSSDASTAVSRHLKEEVCRTFDLCNDIEVIYNFIDPAKYRPCDPCNLRKTYAPDGEKIVIHMSNFRSLKRIPDVVDTFAGIHQKIKSRLILIGEGPDTVTAAQMAEKYGISKDVIFLGSRHDVASILSAGHLFLLPSEHESFGLAAMEALCCGVPAIGTDSTGLPELIDDGKSGFLCKLGDTEDMAEKAVKLLSDEDMWQSFSDHARKSVSEKFHYEKIVAQYEKMYEKVLSK
ncbi:MAG TPA: N-acetyl-alpha-D-glucosaminyl L-malate synthase BshA [candidate division Zixibacteria bacterium]|nr:N-acetyl-alpha-D-glucosaminyl L-malate synthase BshA [candidate division Zixibacteria bacterium]HEQ99517.1 N-acetyl-alpha-D-glucosaminyl L-malate synthase BshA [candidate division Zixibacteria bacterium]